VKSVAVKSEAQQAVLALHRMRQQLIKFRTMQSCQRRLKPDPHFEVSPK
jgi:hypothetical protein